METVEKADILGVYLRDCSKNCSEKVMKAGDDKTLRTDSREK